MIIIHSQSNINPEKFGKVGRAVTRYSCSWRVPRFLISGRKPVVVTLDYHSFP